jgi:hypothetical protein
VAGGFDPGAVKRFNRDELIGSKALTDRPTGTTSSLENRHADNIVNIQVIRRL